MADWCGPAGLTCGCSGWITAADGSSGEKSLHIALFSSSVCQACGSVYDILDYFRAAAEAFSLVLIERYIE